MCTQHPSPYYHLPYRTNKEACVTAVARQFSSSSACHSLWHSLPAHMQAITIYLLSSMIIRLSKELCFKESGQNRIYNIEVWPGLVSWFILYVLCLGESLTGFGQGPTD